MSKLTTKQPETKLPVLKPLLRDPVIPLEIPPEPEPQVAKKVVVQLVDKESPYYGVLFTVGDIADDWVHGFVYVPGPLGAKKEFITTRSDSVKAVGSAPLLSMQPCSRKWIDEHPVQGEYP